MILDNKIRNEYNKHFENKNKTKKLDKNLQAQELLIKNDVKILEIII